MGYVAKIVIRLHYNKTIALRAKVENVIILLQLGIHLPNAVQCGTIRYAIIISLIILWCGGVRINEATRHINDY